MQFCRVFVFAMVLLKATGLQAQVTEDSVMYPRDSAIIADDPTTVFFQQAEKTKTPEKIVLITKAKKTTSLKKMLVQLGGVEEDSSPMDYGFSDLDGDGQKELLLWSYTGWAHCCDELFIYKRIGANKYQHVARIFAGHTEITGEKEFVYGLYENFGYFFTCFACGYSDTSDADPIDMSRFSLRYKSGKLVVVPGTAELKSIINDNLGKLSGQPYEKLVDAGSFDNGLRKEFAFNLANYYYSFGKNMVATQALFHKYYKFPDAKKVWATFVKQLQYMRSENDF